MPQKLIAATKDSWTCFVKRGCFLHADFEISVDGGWGDQNGASFLEFLAVARGGGKCFSNESIWGVAGGGGLDDGLVNS